MCAFLSLETPPVSQVVKPEIAILGGGPTALEAALYARALGYPVTVFERGAAAGTNIRRWGFVKMFTPWHMNVSPLGLAALKTSGLPLPPENDYPTGADFVDAYLGPLADSLGSSFRAGVEVNRVAKTGLIKRESIGGRRRAKNRFRLFVNNEQGREEEVAADLVIDATGVYHSPAALGDGGLPALGERAAAESIDYHLIDIAGARRERMAGKSTLLVGAGFSAATSLVSLIDILSAAPATQIIWARRTTDPAPIPVFPDDPLPLRADLSRRGNSVAADPPPQCRVLAGVVVEAVRPEGELIRVDLRPAENGCGAETVRVHSVLANVGYRPDLDLFRELHVHQCYATEGPMNLAAALLGESAAAGDCLRQGSLGIDTLKNPEPGFFILGNKSYGRRSDYLMRVGREQVRDIFRFLEGNENLDLYRSRAEDAEFVP